MLLANHGVVSQITSDISECLCYKIDTSGLPSIPPNISVTISWFDCNSDFQELIYSPGQGGDPDPSFFCCSTTPVATGNGASYVIIEIVDSENCGGC